MCFAAWQKQMGTSLLRLFNCCFCFFVPIGKTALLTR